MNPILEQGLATLGLTPPPQAIPQLLRYCDLLLEQNRVMNLTAITEPEQVMRFHFLDSAALLTTCDLRGHTVIDVGTGAGFPGLVLKILEPSITLTLLDSLAKRVDWLRTVCDALGLEQVTCLHARAEEQAHDPQFRARYDFAVSRAVAALPILSELCLPYVKEGGAFLAMKSVHSAQELQEADATLRTLGGGTVSVSDYTVPQTDVTHRILSIPKVQATPAAYPRRWSKIQKSKL